MIELKAVIKYPFLLRELMLCQLCNSNLLDFKCTLQVNCATSESGFFQEKYELTR